MALIIAMAWLGNRYIKRPYNLVSSGYELAIKFFANLCTESFGHFHYPSFIFVTALFVFTLFCNLVFLLPFVEEPTRDINTTLALGLSVFLYVQYRGIKAHGIQGHFKEYFEPFFVLFPLHVVGEIAKPVSMSFRLFGNIMGGSIILYLVVNLVSLCALPFMIFVVTLLLLEWFMPRTWLSCYPLAQTIYKTAQRVAQIIPGFYFFGLFESFIQAFVISMLAITYLSMAMAHDAGSSHG